MREATRLLHVNIFQDSRTSPGELWPVSRPSHSGQGHAFGGPATASLPRFIEMIMSTAVRELGAALGVDRARVQLGTGAEADEDRS